MRLDVYAELGGERVLVGLIETVQAAGARFAYSPEWLASRRETLSSSLPLQAEPYPEKKMRPYFDGLLPEGAAREADSIHIASREAERLMESLTDAVPDAVRDSAREFDLAGLPAASPLGDRIASQATERAKSIRT